MKRGVYGLGLEQVNILQFFFFHSVCPCGKGRDGLYVCFLMDREVCVPV